MWSVFGSYRYLWLFNDYKKALCLNKPKSELEIRLMELLLSWNPSSKKLFHLKNTIERISCKNELFSLFLVCDCMRQLTIDEKHIVAWEIISLMNSRIIKNELGYHSDEISYVTLIQNIEQIVLKMPTINIEYDIIKAKLSFLSTVEVSIFKVFKIMIHLLETMKLMDDTIDGEFYEIKFNIKIQQILLFFDNYWSKKVYI
jgi:hypothetical protein